MPELRLSKDLKLPLDAVTRTFGIFGMRGTGKTNTAAVLIEEMVGAGGFVVIFDPVGAWWGLTHQGRGKGLPGIVLGGEHADIPLEETAGALVADLVVSRHWPVVVIDMKLLRKNAQRRFLADCLEDVYLHNRQALHVVFEEADQPLPQNPRGMDPTLARVLGAAEDIVKLGRGRGLGVTLVSQRFATVNANVREQVETLLLMRLMGPLDRKAAKGWIESNGDAEVTATVLDSMASLERGEAWLYSPAWLRDLKRIHVAYRRTFDSSATPEVGQDPIEPGRRAPVDLDELRVRMADTIERANANDPKHLNARIRQLEQQLADREPERVEVPVLTDDARSALEQATTAIQDAQGQMIDAIAAASKQLGEIATKLGAARPAAPTSAAAPGTAARSTPAQRAAALTPPPRAAGAPADDDIQLKSGAVRILQTLAGLHPMLLTKAQVGTLTGFKVTGGTFQTYWSTLKRAGYVAETGGEITVTDAGLARAGTVPPAPATTDEMVAMWGERLKRGARDMLDRLVVIYPHWTTKDELADALDMTATGGTFQTYLSTLRRNGLADVDGSNVRAGDALFITGGNRA